MSHPSVADGIKGFDEASKFKLCQEWLMMALSLSLFLENWGTLKAERPHCSLGYKEAETGRAPVADINLGLCSSCKFREIPQPPHSMQRDLCIDVYNLST